MAIAAWLGVTDTRPRPLSGLRAVTQWAGLPEKKPTSAAAPKAEGTAANGRPKAEATASTKQRGTQRDPQPSGPVE
jgi:hypothetical protein